MISFLKFLDEMAMGQVWDKHDSGHFNKDKDKKYLFGDKSEWMKDKLKKHLQKLNFVDIHFYFGRFPHLTDFELDDKTNNKNYYDEMKAHFFGGKPDLDGVVRKVPKNDIVFVKTGSFADNLTPWMLLHTFAHAVLDIASGQSLISMNNPGIDRSKIKKSVLDANYTAHRIREKLNLEQLYLIFPMGSLRKELSRLQGKKGKFDVLTNDELVREMFVYYLVKGGSIPISEQAQKELPSEVLNKVNELSSQFRNILEACRGEVMVDDRYPE